MSDKHKHRDDKHDTHTQTLADKVGAAYSTARARTSEAVHGTTAGIEANPVVALIGGLALGAVAGALVPRSEKEKALLAPLGARLGDAARAAIDAAKESGTAALSDAGIGKEQLRGQANTLFGNAVKAAGTAGSAAFRAAKDSARS